MLTKMESIFLKTPRLLSYHLRSNIHKNNINTNLRHVIKVKFLFYYRLAMFVSPYTMLSAVVCDRSMTDILRLK